MASSTFKHQHPMWVPAHVLLLQFRSTSLIMAWKTSKVWPKFLGLYIQVGDPEKVPDFTSAQLQPLQPFGKRTRG